MDFKDYTQECLIILPFIPNIVTYSHQSLRTLDFSHGYKRQLPAVGYSFPYQQPRTDIMHCNGCLRDGDDDLIRMGCNDLLCLDCFALSTDSEEDGCVACVCSVLGERTPHRMACNHPICLSCFQQLHLNTGRSVCPVCRRAVRYLYVSRSF